MTAALACDRCGRTGAHPSIEDGENLCAECFFSAEAPPVTEPNPDATSSS